MSVAPAQILQRIPKLAALPPVRPLQNGDTVSRAEFERRYAEHPEIKKAELIEGVVYVASPLFADHGIPHSDAIGWLSVYRSATPGLIVTDNTSLRLDLDNETQPDICAYFDPHATIRRDSYLEIRPPLVVEIAASSAAYDLHQKLRIYQRNAIQEYLVLLVHEQECRWHRLVDGVYQMIRPDGQGILKSQALPGLWLDCNGFWQGNLASVLAFLRQGLQSDEHVKFRSNLA